MNHNRCKCVNSTLLLHKHSRAVLAQLNFWVVHQETSEISETSTQSTDFGARGPQHSQGYRHTPTSTHKDICESWGFLNKKYAQTETNKKQLT